jgi:hypothetical protein
VKQNVVNESGGNGLIESLREKEKALRARIAQALVEQQKREAMNRKRLALIVGDALLDYAEKSPDFKLMLKQVLASAAIDDSARKFLAGRGWV